MASRSFWTGTVAALGAALGAALVFFAAAGPAGAAFPGENGKIAFDRYDIDAPLYSEGRMGDIWTMDPDGSDKKNLTNSALRDENNPAISPDGTRIAFVGCPQGKVCGVYTMSAAGADQRRLADVWSSAKLGITGDPSWSPDGKKIAFVSNRDVLVMNSSDGSDKLNLTAIAVPDPEGYPPDNVDPAWSPDGKKIAFASNRNGQCYYDHCTDFDVWAMESSDGSGKTNITDPDNQEPYGADGGENSPAWAPSGDHLAFASSAQPCNTEIYEVEAPLKPIYFEYWTNLTGDAKDNYCEEARYAPDLDPAYSPDGSKIVFERWQLNSENSYQYDNKDIFVMAASGYYDGSGKTNLTDHPTLESFNPDWGPTCASCPEVEVPPPDNTDPTITGPRPAPGSRVRDRTPTVRAVVRDAASELAETDIQFRVDSNYFPRFSYDPATDRLSYVTKKLSYGRHTAEITVIDMMGNKAERTWEFKVVRR